MIKILVILTCLRDVNVCLNINVFINSITVLLIVLANSMILKIQSTRNACWLRTSGATLWLVATREFSTDVVHSPARINDSYEILMTGSPSIIKRSCGYNFIE